MSTEGLSQLIEQAYADRTLLAQPEYERAVRDTIEQLDKGAIRVASKDDTGEWVTHAWIKQAVLL